jgi:pimeloyl-ACP methyl ester carboxylesterase
MNAMTRHPISRTTTLIGADGNRLVADRFGDGGPPLLLLDGGGQTRHAWTKTAAKITCKGYSAYALDQWGHGDSDWLTDGAYAFSDCAADAKTRPNAIASEM